MYDAIEKKNVQIKMMTIKINKNIISENVNFDKIRFYFKTNHLVLIRILHIYLKITNNSSRNLIYEEYILYK